MSNKMYYPCMYCGSCPVWLAAFNHPELRSYEDVIEACDEEGCPLVGQEVLDSDLV
jgi:hypothetical protein